MRKSVVLSEERFLFRCFRRRDQEERCLTGDFSVREEDRVAGW